jgi:hypothetical protein
MLVIQNTYLLHRVIIYTQEYIKISISSIEQDEHECEVINLWIENIIMIFDGNVDFIGMGNRSDNDGVELNNQLIKLRTQHEQLKQSIASKIQ